MRPTGRSRPLTDLAHRGLEDRPHGRRTPGNTSPRPPGPRAARAPLPHRRSARSSARRAALGSTQPVRAVRSRPRSGVVAPKNRADGRRCSATGWHVVVRRAVDIGHHGLTIRRISSGSAKIGMGCRPTCSSCGHHRSGTSGLGEGGLRLREDLAGAAVECPHTRATAQVGRLIPPHRHLDAL